MKGQERVLVCPRPLTLEREYKKMRWNSWRKYCTYTHTQVYSYVRTCVHAHAYPHKYWYIPTNIHIHIPSYIHTCLYIHACTYMHVHTRTYIHARTNFYKLKIIGYTIMKTWISVYLLKSHLIKGISLSSQLFVRRAARRDEWRRWVEWKRGRRWGPGRGRMVDRYGRSVGRSGCFKFCLPDISSIDRGMTVD